MKKLSSLFLVIALCSITLSAQIRTYNLATGTAYIVHVDQTQENAQIIMGNPNTINTTSQSSDRVEVIGKKNGLYTIKITALTQKTEVVSPMFNVNMDSEDPSTGEGLYAAFKGTSYTFTMKENGEIVEISGLDELIDTIASKVADNPQMKAQISDIFSEESIRTRLTQQFSIFPEGDANEWTRNEVAKMNNIPVEMNTTFTLNGDNTIGAESEISIESQTSQMGTTVDLKLEGTQETTYQFDSTTGMPTSYKSVNDISGNASAQGMQIPMTIRTTTITTLTAEQ